MVIEGPRGTGKELFAKLIHARSGRSGEFVAVDCATLTVDLFESELFGHVKGAFTGAVESTRGLLQQANGGTLFLDEIGNLPLAAQAKLLRVLQERRVRKLGSTKEEGVDVKIVAATLCDLRQMIRERTFREDLYDRLSWCCLELPPLSNREDDAKLIADHFLAHDPAVAKHRKALSDDAVLVLREYAWPGNVRELQKILYRAAVTGSEPALTAEDLAQELGILFDPGAVQKSAETESSLEAVLDDGQWKRPRDLRDALGVSAATVWRQLRQLLAAGQIERRGKGPAVRYRIVEAKADSRADPRWVAARSVIQQRGFVTCGLLAEAIGQSKRTASRLLGNMADAGYLKRQGPPGRGAHYLSPESSPAE